MGRATAVRRLYVLDGGLMDLEPDVLCRADEAGGRTRVRVPMYLLDTSAGFVLIDTGNDPAAGSGGNRPPGRGSYPVQTAEQSAAQQLALVGIAPGDVRTVIYTHLHGDHAGGAAGFPQARHLVQSAEYRFARHPDPAAAAAFPPGNPSTLPLSWQLLDGDSVVLPGIHLMLTPGHTPGHQSVVLWDVPGAGTLIVAGDAVPCARNLAAHRPPGVATDAGAAVASLQRLTALAEAVDAAILVGHPDPASTEIPLAPRPLLRPAQRFACEGVTT